MLQNLKFMPGMPVIWKILNSHFLKLENHRTWRTKLIRLNKILMNPLMQMIKVKLQKLKMNENLEEIIDIESEKPKFTEINDNELIEVEDSEKVDEELIYELAEEPDELS